MFKSSSKIHWIIYKATSKFGRFTYIGVIHKQCGQFFEHFDPLHSLFTILLNKAKNLSTCLPCPHSLWMTPCGESVTLFSSLLDYHKIGQFHKNQTTFIKVYFMTNIFLNLGVFFTIIFYANQDNKFVILAGTK